MGNRQDQSPGQKTQAVPGFALQQKKLGDLLMVVGVEKFVDTDR